MKKINYFMLVIVGIIVSISNIITYAATGDVAINATNFPDENFRI